MKQEHSFTLTAPLSDIDRVTRLLDDVKSDYPQVRISRKTDRGECARFYLSFPFSAARQDLKFLEWYGENGDDAWELFGPTYGRWGLS